jgi:hypothetical protein
LFEEFFDLFNGSAKGWIESIDRSEVFLGLRWYDRNIERDEVATDLGWLLGIHCDEFAGFVDGLFDCWVLAIPSDR